MKFLALLFVFAAAVSAGVAGTESPGWSVAGNVAKRDCPAHQCCFKACGCNACQADSSGNTCCAGQPADVCGQTC
ncbi:hypothetical protein TARUN_7854 [Trichoderma arundinaceum]|uniref:Uncharacterized protein n=1 Tax=Trichoderma arundinaceum TaxID=490622 RepID=A0A395NF59_TRIAR|nr:hypothetical protein TARUN_7854 [Trichoderma arundinaceum]